MKELLKNIKAAEAKMKEAKDNDDFHAYVDAAEELRKARCEHAAAAWKAAARKAAR